ncbi:MAG: hypothetical protein LUD79_03980 [Oscillospiraceae bacterium]|nr:hypothetical protein [Oscillospiraceae bacterium]
MSEEQKPGARKSKERRNREDHANDIRLRLLKKDKDKLMLALNSAKMVGILSKMEIMYVFLFRDQYQCFIHPLDAEEGRHKAWPVNEATTAMIKNLTELADQLFEITPKANMDPMGVMVAAERGIIAYLDTTGQLPAEDMDFMSWQDGSAAEEKK